MPDTAPKAGVRARDGSRKGSLWEPCSPMDVAVTASTVALRDGVAGPAARPDGLGWSDAPCTQGPTSQPLGSKRVYPHCSKANPQWRFTAAMACSSSV